MSDPFRIEGTFGRRGRTAGRLTRIPPLDLGWTVIGSARGFRAPRVGAVTLGPDLVLALCHKESRRGGMPQVRSAVDVPKAGLGRELTAVPPCRQARNTKTAAQLFIGTAHIALESSPK
jgi:hypothetical protein